MHLVGEAIFRCVGRVCVGFGVSVLLCLCGFCRLGCHDGLKIDGGEFAESFLFAASVVGAFDPHGDCRA